MKKDVAVANVEAQFQINKAKLTLQRVSYR